MAKDKTLCIELTPVEANALMVLLDNEMYTLHHYGGGIDLDNWEQLDLEAHKIYAYYKYKKWYMENCE
jgi:hypothetical protein